MNTKPISSRSRRSGSARVFLVLFGLVFFVAGCGTFWLFFVSPLLNILAARSWPTAECSILSSTVVESKDSEGDTTYAPKIKYRFTVNGQQYTSEKYSFFDFSSSGNWARSVVDRFPAGSQQICFYDSDDPQTSVLKRDFSWGNLLGLLPLLFVVVGAGVLGYGLFGTFATSSKAKAISQGVDDHDLTSLDGDSSKDKDDDDDEGPRKLRPETTRVARLVAIGIGGLFWNGFLVVFLSVAWGNGQGPFQGDLCLSLFMIPFVLVGLGLIVGFVHQLLSMWNPTVEIALSRGAVPLGETVDIAWQLEGRVNRIRKLTIEIIGNEKATYRSGTTTSTDTETFQTIEVAGTTSATEMEFGNVSIVIPADTMHSFDGGNNKIVWSINVKGDIPMWPDVSESFPFRIKPKALTNDSN